jgi:hypothetical protein
MQTLTNTPATASAGGPPSPRQNGAFQSLVPDYALLFFDHLYSEYLTLKPDIDDPELIQLLESLHDERLNGQLTWSDIYTFDLALIEERPLENLIRKAYDARAKYRSIAGQKEFDEYLASKPPDLTSILIAPNTPPAEPALPAGEESLETELSQSSEIVQRVLRADIRYLLSKFYLYYSMLPMRENLRERLTAKAVRLTVIVLAIIVVLVLVSVGGTFIYNIRTDALSLGVGGLGLTIGSVAFAGIVGGCVSMLQRIQSAPSEGDALFNLASLTYGWRGLSLSPLYGGIFASLLFILFAAGVLEGSVFPKINTPGKIIAAAPDATPTPTPAAPTATSGVATATPQQAATATPQQAATATPQQAATATPQQAVTATPQQAATASPQQAATATPRQAATATPQSGATATPTPSPTATPKVETRILEVKQFLRETGPVDGVSFALLVIWSFIAGFAERLVPDTLNRLVAKNEAIQGR